MPGTDTSTYPSAAASTPEPTFRRTGGEDRTGQSVPTGGALADQEASARRLGAALRYAERGWPLVPLYGIVDGPDGLRRCECRRGAECRSPGKHPRWSGWPSRTTTNPAVLNAWCQRWPAMNVGIATGHDAGLVVLDFDPRHGSDASLAEMEASYGTLPVTLRHETPSGGFHLMFAWPEGYVVGNALPAVRRYDGVDVRGEGGLIVAPHGRHMLGEYRVVVHTTSVAQLPEWMLANLEIDETTHAAPEGVDRWAWSALLDECSGVRAAPKGRRHDTLLRAATRIGQIAAGEELNSEVAVNNLLGAAAWIKLPDGEAHQVVDDGFRYGAQHPRSRPIALRGRDDALEELAAIWSAVRGGIWKGHPGKRQRALLEGMLNLAHHQGGPVFRAGYRRISLEAGLSHSPTTRGVSELEDQRWLLCLHVGTSSSDPSRWRLRIPSGATRRWNGLTPEPSSVETVPGMQRFDTRVALGSKTPINHDAYREFGERDGWSTSGMKKTGWRIYEHLLRYGDRKTQAQTARETGLSPSTISRNLPALVEEGLVDKSRDGIRAVPRDETYLDRVAARCGTAGSMQRRIDYYARHDGWHQGGLRSSDFQTGLLRAIQRDTSTQPTQPGQLHERTGRLDAPLVASQRPLNAPESDATPWAAPPRPGCSTTLSRSPQRGGPGLDPTNAGLLRAFTT